VDNSQALVGRLTRDPELRFTPSGDAVVNFSIANNKRWQDRVTKEWKEQTSFFDIVAWRELAEHISDSLGKGNEVMVFGRLEQSTWEEQDGTKRSKVTIAADHVGPSLRAQTAQVAKVEHTKTGEQAAAAPADDSGEPF